MINLPTSAFTEAFLGTSFQISYVVRDLEASIRLFTDKLQTGPFVVIEDAASDRMIEYRGAQSKVGLSLAFSYANDVQIELISVHGNGSSPWADFLNEGREGLHHLGFWPENYEESCEKLEAIGFTRDCAIKTTDGAISSIYFKAPASLGHFIELAPNTAGRVRYFQGIKALSQAWDGDRPVRRYITREEYLSSADCVSTPVE
ncbi:VOC family protein [Rhizobium sp. BK456]|uniref:VOC family protein n=1 Tax=Rhizobium sp. BK456 TaxID=2587007 RepID=UPI0016150639|nr:VOC family protein [Rhizobium sp. BK456]MBB3526990.1 catechol 2,3-dioxygenase-like lactoylglutathione lyase family enzyme [Rhizobium sp. BK456]